MKNNTLAHWARRIQRCRQREIRNKSINEPLYTAAHQQQQRFSATSVNEREARALIPYFVSRCAQRVYEAMKGMWINDRLRSSNAVPVRERERLLSLEL